MSGIVRVNKRENPFAQIDKHPLKDENLSWQEKGLLAYLLSLPNDWDLYINELCKHATNGRDSTAAIVSKLIKKGYIIRERKREKGKFKGYDYQVFERPDLAENWKSVNGKSVNGKTVNEKPETTNNNLTDNNLTNNVSKECVNTQNTPPQEPDEIERPTQDDPIITVTDQKEKRKKVAAKKEKFTPPTETDAANYAEERIRQKYPDLQNASQHAESTAEDFINFYGCKNWMVGRTKMKNWKFALNRWIKKNYEEGKYNLQSNSSYGSANNQKKYGIAPESVIRELIAEFGE